MNTTETGNESRAIVHHDEAPFEDDLIINQSTPQSHKDTSQTTNKGTIDLSKSSALPKPTQPPPEDSSLIYAPNSIYNNSLFSDDNDTYATDFDGATETGDEVSIRSIAFSPNNNYIATGGDDKKITIYNSNTFDSIKEHRMKGAVLSMTYSPNGNVLAAGGDDERVSIYDGQSHELKYVIPIDGDAEAISFSPNGQYLAVGGTNEKISIYDTSNSNHNIVKTLSLSGWVLTFAFSPDGKYLALPVDKYIIVYDTQNYEKVREVFMDASIRSIAYSQNGKFLAIALSSDSHRVAVYDASTYKIVFDHPRGREVNTICYSPDSKYLAVGGDDKTVTVYDSLSHEVVKVHRMRRAVLATAFSPDSGSLAVGGYDEKVIIYDMATHKVTKELIPADVSNLIEFADNLDDATTKSGQTLTTKKSEYNDETRERVDADDVLIVPTKHNEGNQDNPMFDIELNPSQSTDMTKEVIVKSNNWFNCCGIRTMIRLWYESLNGRAQAYISLFLWGCLLIGILMSLVGIIYIIG